MKDLLRIDVLDHGYVELIDSMGSDLTTVQTARVSFGNDAETLGDKEQRLIKYLAQHEHTSPFRHATLMLRFKAPLFVARQLWKHVVGITPEFDLEDRLSGFTGGYKDTGWNEQSGRYVEVLEEFYTPNEWRAQSKSNKQGSAGILDSERQIAASELYESGMQRAYKLYLALLTAGAAKEQARIVLPQSTYTSWIWTASLQAMLHVVDLRTKPDAQWEAQQYGLAVRTILMQRFPVCLEQWEQRRPST